jgi:outer membrane protein assembly factor BamA
MPRLRYSAWLWTLHGILFLAFTLFLLPATVKAQQDCITQLKEIRTEGNEVSKREYLIKWSGLHIGQTIDSQTLQSAKQRLLDTGLFKSVQVIPQQPCPAESTLTIRVQEKYYQLLYPRISRSADGDIDRGITYRADNLFGGDQRLSLTLSRKDYIEGNTSDRIRLNYRVDLFEYPYRIQWSLKSSETLLADTDNQVSKKEDLIGLAVGRDWLSNPLGYPVKVLVKLDLHENTLVGDESLVDIEPGQYNTFGIRFEYDKVHNHIYRRSGKFFALEINRGLHELGSDFDASHFQFEARFYQPLNGLDNLNSRFIVAMASEKIFNLYNYSVGGADSLRGVESGAISGNSLWQTNIEYILGFRKWQSFRLVLFSDVGNVFEDYTRIDNHGWKQTFGVGIRWKINALVNTDLVMDYAYDPDSGYSKIYAGTSLIF